MRRASVPVVVLLIAAAGALAPGPAVAADVCLGQTVTIVGTPGQPLVGTPNSDVVLTNGASSVEARAGDDLVCHIPYSGGQSVRLGTGDDELVLDHDFSGDTGVSIDGAHYNGQAGKDRVYLVYAGRVAVNLKNSTVDLDAESAALTSFEHTRASGLHVFVTGTTGDNDLQVLGCDVTARSLAGDDVLFTAGGDGDLIQCATPRKVRRLFAGPGRDVFGPLDPGPELDGAILAGGPGRDLVSITGGTRPVLDLGSGTFTTERRGRRNQARLLSVEDGALAAKQALLIGSAGANRLAVTACSGRVVAGGGDDRVDLDRPTADDQRCTSTSYVALGGAGNDRLSGTDRADRLIGGPGRDLAGGWRGRDTCDAEVERACEP